MSDVSYFIPSCLAKPDIGGKMDPTGQRTKNPDIFDQMWMRSGKAHKLRIAEIVDKWEDIPTLETIWYMVELSGIRDETDQLWTFQELVDIRREMRKVLIRVLAAIS